jgi:hypothetical protein
MKTTKCPRFPEKKQKKRKGSGNLRFPEKKQKRGGVRGTLGSLRKN